MPFLICMNLCKDLRTLQSFDCRWRTQCFFSFFLKTFIKQANTCLNHFNVQYKLNCFKTALSTYVDHFWSEHLTLSLFPIVLIMEFCSHMTELFYPIYKCLQHWNYTLAPCSPIGRPKRWLYSLTWPHRNGL
jgi:hypothetical protein